MSLTTHRVIQYIVIITLCTLAGGGYWYWKDQQAKAAVALKTATDTGLVAYWSFDEGSGTTAEDFSPANANTGTLTNGPTWVDGKVGKALNFDGTNDYVTMGNTNDITTGDFTLAYWMNPENVSQVRSVIGKRENVGPYRQYQVGVGYINGTGVPVSAKKVFFFGNNANADYQSVHTTNDVVDGQWHHVTVTRTSSGILIYIDGVSVPLTTQAAGLVSENFTNPANFNLGYDNGSNYYKGLLDEVRIYNRALSGTEITNLYQTSAKASMNTSENSDLTNGLVGLWSFNGADVSGTTAYDRSGQSNNGTLTSGPTVTPGRIGQALRFDGSDDYVSYGTNIAFNSSDFTIAGWFNLTGDAGGADGDAPIFSQRIDNTGSGQPTVNLFVRNSNDRLRAQIRDNIGAVIDLTGGTLINQRQWYHGVMVKTASSLTLYVNGVSDGSVSHTLSGDFDANATHRYIGKHTYDGGEGGYLNGFIDEVRVYNRALSATEIWNLYQAGGGANLNSADSQGDALERGLSGYWKLDDGSGTSATDASTNGNTGTLTNGPTWTTGQIGGAVSFDGSDDYVNTTSTIDTSLYTVCSWVYPQSNGLYQRIITTPSGNTHKWLLTFSDTVSNSQFIFSRNSGSEMGTGTGATSLNTWHHVCGVWDGTTSSVYLDGVSKSNSVEVGWVYGAGSGLSIGRRHDNNYYFQGRLDEVRVYNRALSAEEIAKLYKSTAPDNPDTSLKGYWSFNGPDVSGTTASDRSGQSNHGTLTNGPIVTPGKIGQALSFDGSNDYVSAGDVNAVDGASTVTLSGWFKRGASNAYLTVGKATNNDNGFNINFYNDGRVYVNVGGGGFGNAYGYFNSNDTNWHHVVFVFDGNLSGNDNRAKAYLDGAQQSLTFVNSIPATTQSSSDSFEIGRGVNLGTYSSGSIDEVRLYSRAFTQTEVTNLYNLGR